MVRHWCLRFSLLSAIPLFDRCAAIPSSRPSPRRPPRAERVKDGRRPPRLRRAASLTSRARWHDAEDWGCLQWLPFAQVVKARTKVMSSGRHPARARFRYPRHSSATCWKASTGARRNKPGGHRWQDSVGKCDCDVSAFLVCCLRDKSRRQARSSVKSPAWRLIRRSTQK